MKTAKICKILKDHSEVKCIVGVIQQEAVCVIMEKERDFFVLVPTDNPEGEKGGYFNQQSAVDEAQVDFPGVKFVDFCALQGC